MRKRIKLGFIGLLIVGLISWYGYQKWYADYLISQEQIQINIPKSAKVLEIHNDIGGVHGDGDFYAVFQFTKEQMDEFKKKALETGNWKPIPYDLDYKIASNVKNGLYYYHDVQAERMKKEPQRKSDNYRLAVADFDINKLYVYIHIL